MNKIDFSHPGGFPLTQDELDYLQQAYIACIQAMGSVGVNGATPTVLNGMAVTGGGNTVANGWFVYGGELIQFTGGTVVPAGGEVALVLITDQTTNLTYNDTSTFPSHHSKTATLTHAATVTDATHFPVSALISFGQALGLNNREAWNSLIVNTGLGNGSITGTLYYKKDLISNTLHIKAQLAIGTPMDFAATPQLVPVILCAMPGTYAPSLITEFMSAVECIDGGTPANIIKDDAGSDYIRAFTTIVFVGGAIGIVPIKPASAPATYNLFIQRVISLD